MQKALAVMIVSLGLAAVGAWAGAPAGARAEVTVRGGHFSPATVNVGVGDTVVWINGDDLDHTITAEDGSFESGKIKAGGRFQHRFTRAGTFNYSCSLHPRERGRVVVGRK